MIYDTHAHCYWESLEPRIDEVVQSMFESGVTKATQIGCDIKSSEKAIALARRFPWVFYATVGFHPETAQDMSFTALEDNSSTSSEAIIWELESLIVENKQYIVAVGECGFDFHYIDGTDGWKIPADLNHLTEKAQEQIENQKYWWIEQWKLAQKYNLPLVIHTRDARDATLEFMRSNGINRCVMHCYSEDWEFARALLEFSDEIYFSFSGILTYKKSEKIQEAAKNIPLNRILVETDAPFLAPQPVRWKVNEPAYTRYTLEKLAELRWLQVLDIEDIIYANSLRFYGLQS